MTTPTPSLSNTVAFCGQPIPKQCSIHINITNPQKREYGGFTIPGDQVMDFTEFCISHFSAKRFTVGHRPLALAIAVYPHVGDQIFSGSVAFRASGHGNIGSLMSALCHGGVLLRISKSTKVYQYQFNPDFISLMTRWQTMYRAEHPALPVPPVQVVG